MQQQFHFSLSLLERVDGVVPELEEDDLGTEDLQRYLRWPQKQ